MNNPSLRWWRISMGCAAIPIAVGWGLLLAWNLFRWDFLILCWYLSIYGSILSCVPGIWFLAKFFIAARRETWVKPGTVALRTLASVGMILGGFPISPGLMVLAAFHTEATVMLPPRSTNSVRVLLAVYGRHSSLLFRVPNGGLIEYAYGSWSWYAQGNDSWWNALPILLFPNQGTLGRRRIEEPLELNSLQKRIYCLQLHSLWIPRDRAESLLRKLEDRFQRQGSTSLYNHYYDLTFVKDTESYWCLNNCNHVVGRWLDDLGCQVVGSGGFPAFQVQGGQ